MLSLVLGLFCGVSISVWLETIGKSNSKWYHKGKTEGWGYIDNNGILHLHKYKNL